MNNVKLFRKKEKGLALGLCSGLSESLSVNVWMMRIGFVALTLFGGIGVIAYLITSFSLSLKNSPKNESKRYLGLCLLMSRKWNMDLSILRFVMTYLIIMAGILPGLAIYVLAAVFVRILRK